MSRFTCLLLVGLVAFVGGQSRPVFAQSGNFLESLFRSIAERQMQDASDRPSDAVPDRNATPRTPGGFPGGPLGGPDPRPPAASRPEINAGPRNDSRQPAGPRRSSGRPVVTMPAEVQALADQLQQFDAHLDAVLMEMKRSARTNPAVSALLPEVYELHAQNQALLSACQTARSADRLIDRYRDLDRHWRDVSFRLRSLPDRSTALRDSISVCDRDCRNLGRRYDITPQYDVRALRDQMIIASTYMQTLLDDLQNARMPLDQVRELVRQGRRLRQALLDEADQVRPDDYEGITSRLTDYVIRWREFADEVAAARDPILDQRLARITQCAEESYALLWMSPPTLGPVDSRRPPLGPTIDEHLLADAASLHDISEYFVADAQRMRRYIRPAQFGDDLALAADRFHHAAENLHRLADVASSTQGRDRSSPDRSVQQAASEMTTAWQQLEAKFAVLARQADRDRRIAALQRQYQGMLPLVAHLSAAFMTGN